MLRVSKEIVDLAEKIKKYRIDKREVEELRIKNEALEKQISEMKESIKLLKLNEIEKSKQLVEIEQLEGDNKRLKLDIERLRNSYSFIITTPDKASNTVYGEVSRELSSAKEEVLICSPWITYVIDEFSGSKKVGNKKKIDIKIITRLLKEDIEKGVTDLDKFRVLKNTFGAEIRYNNNLHAKMVIIDRSVAIISSANLTKKGLSVNYEAGVCIRDRNMVPNVVQFFGDMWSESIPLTENSIKLCMQGKKEIHTPTEHKSDIRYTMRYIG